MNCHAGPASPADVARRLMIATSKEIPMKASDRKSESAEALTSIRNLVQPGDTLYVSCPHVSRSGMSRLINVHAIRENEQQWLSGYIASAGLFPLDKRDALRVGGCGMDMGFHVVYNLAQALYPEGFGCIGDKCPSNDHANGDRDYTPHGARRFRCVRPDDELTGCQSDEECAACTVGVLPANHWHKSGGYALKHRWI